MPAEEVLDAPETTGCYCALLGVGGDVLSGGGGVRGVETQCG